MGLCFGKSSPAAEGGGTDENDAIKVDAVEAKLEEQDPKRRILATPPQRRRTPNVWT